MRAATEGSLPSVMPQGNLVQDLGREVRQGSPGELMVESTPSRQRRPPCKTNKEESDEAADTAALTYLLTYLPYDRPTGHNDLLRTPGPPGERKLDRVRRCECAPRHASPVARASSSRLSPTENQLRWGCLQDRAFGLAPGPWAPESGG